MNRDQLSSFNPTDFSQSHPPDLNAIYLQPVARAAKSSARQQVLDRILNKIAEQDLPGKSYVEQYLRHKYRRNCKANTLRQAAISLEQFLSFFANRGNTVLEQLSREDIEAFVEDMQDRGLKLATVNTRLRNVYAFIRFLIMEYKVVSWELMERKIKLKLPDRLPRAIDPQHLDQLLSTIDNCRDRALILLLLRTGMRIGELRKCKVEDIDLFEQTILIYQSDKTCVGRTVYYSADAQQALLAWLRLRDPHKQHLFYGHKDKPLSYEAARCVFKKCLQKAGLQYNGYSLHCLRHTFATDLLNATMPLECLRELLGHCSMQITRRYARLSDKTREEEYFKAMDRILKGARDENDQCDR
ncbi:MAG: tyrosine-type recombinase/integrase [Desulfobacterales bacterium]|jgi:integrase/recombinase XerD